MAAKLPQPSALNRLLQSQAFPTLGEIAYASNRDANWNDPSLSREDEARRDALSSLWECYDSKFKMRDDYRAWRTLLRPFAPSEVSKSWSDPLGVAFNGLQNPDPIIVWGILSILPRVITGRYSSKHAIEQLLLLAEKSEIRIFNGLRPIPHAEAGCGLVKVLALNSIMMVRLHGYGSLTNDQLHLHFHRLRKYLKELDKKWILGRSVSLKAVRNERKTGRVVAPFNDIKMLLGITKALSNYRIATLASIEEMNPDTDQLLKQAFILASSAWRSSRSLRRFEEDWRSHNRPRYTAINMDKLVLMEMQALQNVTLAARDAGFYLLSAAMGHLFLRVVPDRLVPSRKITRTVKALLHTIGTAGLEVDHRFTKSLRERKDESSQQKKIENSSANSDQKTVPQNAVDKNRIRDTSRILKLRLAKDMETDPAWQQLVAICAPELQQKEHRTPLVLLQELTVVAKNLYNKEAIKCAFNLSLKYGRIGAAANLLNSFEPQKEDILYFARSIKYALQIMPYGMNVKKHSKWQMLLRKSWNSLPDVDSATPAEVLLIHEVLLGRYLSIVRNARPKEAKVFAEKYYGLLSPSEIKETIENNINITSSVSAPMNNRGFQEILKQTARSKLGLPVCLSLVATDQESWSFLATDISGRWLSMRVRIPNVFQMAEILQKTHKLWFRKVDNQNTLLELPWGRELTQLAKTIVSMVQKLQPNCSWLMLAIEPELATLPWQALIGRSLQNLVVSLIPSFNWTSTVQRNNVAFKRGMFKTLSNVPDLSTLREQIHRTEGMLPYHLLSASVVLGHGTWTQGSIPSVAARQGGPLHLRDWVSLADYRISVVHSCYGGKVEHKFLGDLGGLPGLSLGFNCRLFCAPVAEVSLNTAHTLHKHLFKEEGPKQFGMRYLAAIKEDPAVALYNLYGFANEPITQSEDPATGTQHSKRSLGELPERSLRVEPPVMKARAV